MENFSVYQSRIESVSQLITVRFVTWECPKNLMTKKHIYEYRILFIVLRMLLNKFIPKILLAMDTNAKALKKFKTVSNIVKERLHHT